MVECRAALHTCTRQGESRIRRQFTSLSALVMMFVAGITVGLLRGPGSSQPARAPSIAKVIGQFAGMLGPRVISIALQSLLADPGDKQE